MGMLTTQNVEEYKQKYDEELKAKSIQLGTDITDEMITEGVYKNLSRKADRDWETFP